ncbi:Gp19/Gp15/Gp42 family protein [Saccharopolyspora pogona]|uniref:Gp19/Gp15/Gp42 family protein n=1 Tax=Saccharopolyspora pogona TaxID=333966 RepID=UPI0016841407|nr:Gp19/Gp15/Gp42 family protein [Saccharopolyspora pogona]
MAYATPADVEARLGRPLDASETQVVSARLHDSELIIRNRIPDLDERVADGRIDRDVVVLVEVEMVLRLVRNPEGYTAETDGNYSYQLSSDVASGHLSVLPSEWGLLGVRGGIYTIKPYVDVPTNRSGEADPNWWWIT